MIEDRLIALETKASYQEDLLQELNKLVISQHSQLSDLATLCAALKDQLQIVMQALPDHSNADEKPPHY